MTLKINFNLNLPDSCCTLVPKNGVWTVPKIAACQIAKNAALLIPDYIHRGLTVMCSEIGNKNIPLSVGVHTEKKEEAPENPLKSRDKS